LSLASSFTSPTLKMEAARSPKTTSSFYQISRRHAPRGNTYRSSSYSRHKLVGAFLASALDGGEWPVCTLLPHCSRETSPRYPLDRTPGRPHTQSSFAGYISETLRLEHRRMTVETPNTNFSFISLNSYPCTSPSSLPRCLHNRLTDGAEVFSLTRRPPIIPWRDSWYSFLYRLSQHQSHCAAGRIR
jgi:hypothetical protein